MKYFFHGNHFPLKIFKISGIFLIILLGDYYRTYCQTDYEFWFVAPAVTYQTIAPSPVLYDHMNQPIALYFTTASGPAIVKVEQPANPSFAPIYRTVTNSTAGEVILTGFIDSIENKPANTILNRGLRITSNRPITASYEIQSPYNAATYTLSGRNALGTEFIIPSQNHYQNYPYTDPPAKNVFDIVASEDSTVVTIIPKSGLIGHAANDTFAIVLSRGQTWSGRALSNDSTAHLGGSFVLSDKPIAVTLTDDAVFFPNTTPEAFDITGDQLTPRQVAGKEFVIWDLRNLPEAPKRLLVYGYENATDVNFTDSLQNISKTINRGEYAEFSTLNDSLAYYGGSIHSSKPVSVYYFTGIGNKLLGMTPCPQAMSGIVPPIGCGGSKRVSFTRTPPVGMMNEWYWFIVTRNGNQGNFLCTPSWIILPPTVFYVIPGTNGEYVGVDMGFGGFSLYSNVTIWNTKGSFQLSERTNDVITTTVQYAKYSYATDFSSLYLGTDKKICPGDSVILDAGWGRDSYLWNTGDTTQVIRVKSPGIYWVTITQDNCTLSDTIVVSYYWNQPINLGPDREICSGDSIQLNAGSGRSWYFWNTGDSTQTIWAKNQGIYWVKAPDVHCIISDTVLVTLTSPPVITNNPLSKSICSGESANISLTSNVPGTMFHWTPTLTLGNISGYSSDSGLVINQTLVNHLATPGIVTYHITPKVGSCAGSSVDFVVTVNPGDSAKVSITASANNICAGTPVLFTASPANPGTTPIYQWK
ncbi:MAG: PKD-like domain-containing protein, partial [Bacteroidota bacterium]